MEIKLDSFFLLPLPLHLKYELFEIKLSFN